MRVREQYTLATTAAEAMVNLWELEHQQGGLELDGMMRRPKDLSAYSLAHAEIMEQREGVELLALAMFFGATSDNRYHQNQERLKLLSEETIDYNGRADVIEEEIARRKSKKWRTDEDDDIGPFQPRLL